MVASVARACRRLGVGRWGSPGVVHGALLYTRILLRKRRSMASTGASGYIDPASSFDRCTWWCAWFHAAESTLRPGCACIDHPSTIDLTAVLGSGTGNVLLPRTATSCDQQRASPSVERGRRRVKSLWAWNQLVRTGVTLSCSTYRVTQHQSPTSQNLYLYFTIQLPPYPHTSNDVPHTRYHATTTNQYHQPTTKHSNQLTHCSYITPFHLHPLHLHTLHPSTYTLNNYHNTQTNLHHIHSNTLHIIHYTHHTLNFTNSTAFSIYTTIQNITLTTLYHPHTYLFTHPTFTPYSPTSSQTQHPTPTPTPPTPPPHNLLLSTIPATTPIPTLLTHPHPPSTYLPTLIPNLSTTRPNAIATSSSFSPLLLSANLNRSPHSHSLRAARKLPPPTPHHSPPPSCTPSPSPPHLPPQHAPPHPRTRETALLLLPSFLHPQPPLPHILHSPPYPPTHPRGLLRREAISSPSSPRDLDPAANRPVLAVGILAALVIWVAKLGGISPTHHPTPPAT